MWPKLECLLGRDYALNSKSFPLPKPGLTIDRTGRGKWAFAADGAWAITITTVARFFYKVCSVLFYCRKLEGSW
jgi:hypothetical protein